MAIEVSKPFWAASYRPQNSGKYNKDPTITKEHLDAAAFVLREEAETGKGCKYRYLSDRKFKTKEAAEAFYKPLMEKHLILRQCISIGEMAMMAF